MRKLDWETGIDERKEEIWQLGKKKQDLEGEVYIINKETSRRRAKKGERKEAKR